MRGSQGKGSSLIEVLVAFGLLGAVFGLLYEVIGLASRHTRSGEVMANLQAALVLQRLLEQDLANAVADPASGELARSLTTPRLGIAFYRSVLDPQSTRLVLAPVRWELDERPDADAGTLVRTAWNPLSKQFETRRFEDARIPLGTSGSPDSGPGFRTASPEESGLTAVFLTVVLGGRRGATAFAVPVQDRLALPIRKPALVWPPLSDSLFTIDRKIEELPAN